jgi:hypothetical protein
MLNIPAYISLSTFGNTTLIFLLIFSLVHYTFFPEQIVRAARWPGKENRTTLVAWTGFKIDTASVHT